MAEPTEAEKKVVNGSDAAGNNGADKGTPDPKDGVGKDKSVPLATFLDAKNKAKQLEVDLDTMKAEKKAGEEAKLKADGKLQELIDAKEQDLALTKAELETARTEAAESKQFKAAKVEAYKTKLGTKWNDEYSKLSLLALDALVNSILATSTDIKLDKGATGEHASIELTADQKRDAYAKYPHISKEKAEEYHKHNLIKVGIIKEK